MPTLTSVSLLCLFNNESRSMRILGSGMKGFGLLNFSLDWTAVGAAGPLYTPLWAALNYYVGIMGAMFVVMPCLYFLVGENGFWDAQKFDSPLGAGLYGGDYKKFNVSSVLDSENMLDPAKWKQNSPLLLTPWVSRVSRRVTLRNEVLMNTRLTSYFPPVCSVSVHATIAGVATV